VSRDRRKPHVRRADEEAEAIAAATESEGEGDSRAAAPCFPDILHDQVPSCCNITGRRIPQVASVLAPIIRASDSGAAPRPCSVHVLA